MAESREKLHFTPLRYGPATGCGIGKVLTTVCDVGILPTHGGRLSNTLQEAIDLLRYCLEDGEVKHGKHFREELAKEKLSYEDAWVFCYGDRSLIRLKRTLRQENGNIESRDAVPVADGLQSYLPLRPSN